MENELPLCHVCGKLKKPYIVFMEDSIMAYLSYEQARKDGDICEPCWVYYCLTGELTPHTDDEMTIAKEAQKFTKMMNAWWTQKEPLDSESPNKREWGGTVFIAQWAREYLSKHQQMLPKKCEEINGTNTST